MEHTDNRLMPPLASYLSGEAFSADLSFRPAIIGHAQARGDWLVQAVAQFRLVQQDTVAAPPRPPARPVSAPTVSAPSPSAAKQVRPPAAKPSAVLPKPSAPAVAQTQPAKSAQDDGDWESF